MFKRPFSFDGRIRRTEYGVTLIIYFVVSLAINLMMVDFSSMLGLLFIPLVWFFWAQGAKRCHDMDNSGWFQLLPFYCPFWMLFQDGTFGPNRFGDNPKGLGNKHFDSIDA